MRAGARGPGQRGRGTGGGARPAGRARRGRGGRSPVTLDRISLLGLRAFGRHGVLEHEGAIGQEFIIDAVLGVDTRAAAAADDLTLTVDYGALADRLAAIVSRTASGADRDAGRATGRRLPGGGGGPRGRDHRAQAARPGGPDRRRRHRDHLPEPHVTVPHPPGPAAPHRRPAVVLALGTNLGDRLANLQRAVDLLCAGELPVRRGLRRLRDRAGGRPAPGRLPERGAAGPLEPARRRAPEPEPGRRGGPAPGPGASAGGRARWTWTSSPTATRSAPTRR